MQQHRASQMEGNNSLFVSINYSQKVIVSGNMW